MLFFINYICLSNHVRNEIYNCFLLAGWFSGKEDSFDGNIKASYKQAGLQILKRSGIQQDFPGIL